MQVELFAKQTTHFTAQDHAPLGSTRRGTMTDQEKQQEGGQQAGAQHQQDQHAASESVAVLEARVQELEGQQGDLTDRLLRAHAEMDNLRKRMEREKIDGAKYAITKFAVDIVGISDNFQRAIAAVPPGASDQDGPLKSMVEGVVMTERAFLQVLERHGVRRIDPMGELFNPNRHQAVMEQDNPEVPAGTVIQVFQLGYMIEDRILRPAMVVVAKGGAKPAKSADSGNVPPASNDNSGA